MASLLNRALQPGSGVGLTAGVDYFRKGGRAAKGGVNPGVESIKKVDATAPQGTGISINPSGGESGFSQPISSGGTPGASPIGMSAAEAQALGLGTQAVGLAGALTGNTALQQMAQAGNLAGTGLAAANGNYGPLGSVLGGLVAGPAGAVAGGALAGGSPASAINGVIGMANPSMAIANATLGLGTGLFGDTPTTLGDIAMNSSIGTAAVGNQGMVDTAQAGMAINNSPDPLGAFAATQGINVSANPAAAQAGAQALGWGLNVTPEVAQSMVNTNNTNGNMGYGANSGGYGLSSPDGGGMGFSSPDSGTVSANTGPDNAGGGISAPAQTSDSFGFTSSGGLGLGGGGFGPDGGGGFGPDAPGGMKDGGLIGADMPGLTMRYADGGPVMGQSNMQMPMGGQPNAQMMQAQIGQMMRDPQTLQRLLARPVQLMQSGELTPDEVVTMGRVAEAAIYNPSLYPQLRQFVAAQGMTPLPASFDPSVILNIIVIARGLQQMQGQGQGQMGDTQPGQIPLMAQAQMENPVGMANGGYLRGPGTGRSDSIGTLNTSTAAPVKVANGEYVIPEHVVRAKGRDFFDSLLRKYTSMPKGE